MRSNLIKTRKKRRLSQKQTAKELGITERQYQKIEAGTSDGSMKIWRKLSAMFDETINFLDRID